MNKTIKKCISTERKQQKFEVETDDSGDFKIASKGAENSENNEKPISTYSVGTKTEILKEERVTKIKEEDLVSLCDTKKLTGRPVVRSKPFIPIGLPKKEIQKIRRNVAVQRIADYVRIVSPDDGIVDEKAFLAWIKWSLLKKYPDKYLEITKKRGIMVPCGDGRLRFTRSW